MDELQIVGEPRQLSETEVKSLAEILSAEDTWYERQADGTLKGMKAMCMVRWDFKFLFEKKGGELVVMRLCSSCRQVSIRVDQKELRVPDIQAPAMKKLEKFFDEWFPGWAEISAKGREAEGRSVRERDRSSKK